MALRIETFDNARGGNTLYKALTHPLAAQAGHDLVADLARQGPVAIVDSQGAAAGFAEIFGLDATEICGAYVQDVAAIGRTVLGRKAAPVTELAESRARAVLVATFDAARLTAQLEPFLPAGARVLSLDALRIPEERLTNRRSYLDPLNFATNFALFRDADGLYTRLATANYWAGYGSSGVTCWLTLFDASGSVIAEWSEAFGPEAAAITIDSREVRRRFGLGEFAGQLFLHVSGAAGHDVVKYALDTFGQEDGRGDGALSCTGLRRVASGRRSSSSPSPNQADAIATTASSVAAVAVSAGRSRHARRARGASPSNTTRQASTGSAMFLIRCWPIGAKASSSRLRSSSRTLPETQIPPGRARPSSRAAMFTPSP